VRTWITVLVLIALLIAGGVLITQLQSGEPISLTSGYVPQLDGTQALILVGAVVAILVLLGGMGVTLAVVMSLGSKEIALIQGQASKPRGRGASRAPQPNPSSPEAGRKPMGLPMPVLAKSLAIAANVVVLAFVAFLTVNRFVLNPPQEGVEATEAQASAASASAAQASGPADLLAAVDALPAGDALRGQAEFKLQPCAPCHSLKPDERIVGPSLAGVATRAATRKPGYSESLYLYESIVKPSAYVVPGFPDGVMPATFGQTITSQKQADLIAFLLTQK
jgi:cytochrome c2